MGVVVERPSKKPRSGLTKGMMSWRVRHLMMLVLDWMSGGKVLVTKWTRL